jgi:hypothetical protein
MQTARINQTPTRPMPSATVKGNGSWTLCQRGDDEISISCPVPDRDDSPHVTTSSPQKSGNLQD